MQYRTALYGRTSKDDKRKVTVELQQTTLRPWAVSDPFAGSVVDEYWDEGVSGKIPLWNRPEGVRLLADIDAGKIQSVAVVFIDRLGRTTLDSLQAAAKLEERGVKLVAVNDGWDARRNDDPLYFQIRAAIAEAEWRRIRDRMEGGKKRAAERDGCPPGGSLVFGYRMLPNGHYEIDPVEAAVVRHVFRMASDGCSQTEILAWLRTCGVAPGRRWQRRDGSEIRLSAGHESTQWQRTRIYKMLRNRTYLGERRWKTTVYPCPAIIDRELWDRVQAICERYERMIDADRLRGLASGLLRCATCKNRFHYDHNRGYRANYRCEGRTRYRVCRADRIPVADVDTTVWQAVRDYLEDPARILREAVSVRGTAEESLAEIETEEKRIKADLDAIEADVQSIQEEQAARGLPFAWILPQLDALNSRRNKLLSEQAELTSRRANVRLDSESIEKAVALATIGTVGELFNALPERRREIITQHVVCVEVMPARRVAIHFKWGGVADFPITSDREVCYASFRLIRDLPA